MAPSQKSAKTRKNALVIGKPVAQSQITMTEMVLPSDTNALGTIFGGKVVSLIDIAAAMAAGKHSRSVVVTASIDALHFVTPVKLGEYIHIKASVNHAGRTSMEVGVRVDKENPLTGEMKHTATAYLTFVALDSKGKPKAVPPVIPETEAEVRRQDAAKIRRGSRMHLAEALRAAELSPPTRRSRRPSPARGTSRTPR